VNVKTEVEHFFLLDANSKGDHELIGREKLICNLLENFLKSCEKEARDIQYCNIRENGDKIRIFTKMKTS
jgi:hypothetical protein